MRIVYHMIIGGSLLRDLDSLVRVQGRERRIHGEEDFPFSSRAQIIQL